MDEHKRREFRADLVERLDFARGTLEKVEELIQEAEDDAELWRQTGDALSVQEANDRLVDLRQEQRDRQDEVNRLSRALAQFDDQRGPR